MPQLFMTNISVGATLVDVKLALANKLHGPPFPTDPPINFHVFFLPNKGRGGGPGRRAIVTFPNHDIAEHFLALNPTISVNKSNAYLKWKQGKMDMARARKVSTTEYIDPRVEQQDRERMSRVSSSISLRGFHFGRFRRDGTFSGEVSGHGEVFCDLEARELRIAVRTKAEPETDSASIENDDVFSSMISNMLARLTSESLFQERFSIHFAPSQIHAIAVSELSSDVFIETLSPPSFQSVIGEGMLSDLMPSPQRRTSFTKDRVLPPVLQGLRLQFRSPQDSQIFRDRCASLHLPNPFPRELVVHDSTLYDDSVMRRLQDLMHSLDFEVAFEVDKAVQNALLEPGEALSMEPGLITLQDRLRRLHYKEEEKRGFPSAIFIILARMLPFHGLRAIRRLPTRIETRKKRKKKVVQAVGVVPPVPQDLVVMLASATDEFLASRASPRRRYARSSPGVYSAFQAVVTPTRTFLEGPLPDQSSSLLRRYGNHSHFLKVSFQDERGGKIARAPDVAIDALLSDRYKRVLTQGITVGGRHYDFLCYSMSGLKMYQFMFVHPFVFVDPLHGEIRLTADSIRKSVGDLSKVAREPALLAARYSLVLSGSSPSVTVEEVWYIDDLPSNDNAFSDGCGTISVSLMQKVWNMLKPGSPLSPPSCIQFRFGGAKGVLVVDPRLQGEMMCLRKSQVKYQSGQKTLDIAATSARPIPMYLNRPLIALLEHHRVPSEVFLDLQKAAVDETRQAKESFVHAARVFSYHGLGEPFRLPTLFGNLRSILSLDSKNHTTILRHDLIDTCLSLGVIHILRDIKHRAHVFVPGSYTLIGVADAWDCLQEGEVYATVHDPKTGLYKEIEGNILITRPPQIHPGDVQFVNAVRRPEVVEQLGHLRNVVVFSCRGERSLPSCLGGGDLDGDIYNLILDPRLHPPSRTTAIPGAYTPVERKKTPVGPDGQPREATIDDIADFVVDYIKGDLLGYISILHLRISDLEGLDCESCLLLAEKASHAVDFPKSGVPVDMKTLPRPPNKENKPDYLSGEGMLSGPNSPFYPSEKILGQLFRAIPDSSLLYRSQTQRQTNGYVVAQALSTVPIDGILMQDLLGEVDEDLWDEMENILVAYSVQLHAIAKTHTVSKRPDAYLGEAELVSGSIQEKYGDPRKRREAEAAMNTETAELVRLIRQEFKKGSEPPPQDESDEESEEETWDDDFDDEYDRGREVLCSEFRRAWAAWQVAEDAVHQSLESNNEAFGAQSFGLIALGVMLEILKKLQDEY